MHLQSPDLVEALLASGADPNLKTPDGDYPLQRALYYASHGEIGYRYLDVLLSHGGNLNSQFTPPLHQACLFGDLRLVQYFLDHGADPSLYDGDDRLPADRATSSESQAPESIKEAILSALASHLPNPNATDA
jgi:ankyrin repeat protein